MDIGYPLSTDPYLAGGHAGTWTVLDINDTDIPDIYSKLTFGRTTCPSWFRLEDLSALITLWYATIRPQIKGHTEVIRWGFEAALLSKPDSFPISKRDGKPWRATWADFEELALESGVDAMVDAFFAGVPMEDLILDPNPPRFGLTVYAWREERRAYESEGRFLFT